MLLNLMEGDTITKNALISSIKNFNTDGQQHGTIKALLKNFILPETDMAIKENRSNREKCVYTIPAKPPLPTLTERMKSINDAKQAFLNSTVTSNPVPTMRGVKKEEHNIHYAQIAITSKSDDTRSTGGGKETKPPPDSFKNKDYSTHVHVSPTIKKNLEQQQRRVSFKIKNASTSHKRPPLAKTISITSSNVSELTKKFNNLQTESHPASPRQSKLAKTIEDLQSASRCTASNSSTPSSTLSSSPNIKIVLRPRRGSKKRNSRTRCSSMDSIDNYLGTAASTKSHVIRSKSDGTKSQKSTKKRLKYQDSSEQPSGSDSVDGSPVKIKDAETKKEKTPVENIVVKNFIKMFECEIIAQSTSNDTLKRQPEKSKSTILARDKPKVPEKKSSLVVTKNLVVKDGIPKIKTIKPILNESPVKLNNTKEQTSEVQKKKELLYDRKKYRTNFIHSEKLPLKVVEIIPEDAQENSVTASNAENDHKVEIPVINIVEPKSEETLYQEINPQITPNQSFLWRRKSSTQIYSDSEKSLSESSYSLVSVTLNGSTITCSDEPQDISAKEESQTKANESQVNIVNTNANTEPNMDFESNLVEAVNKEIMVGYTIPKAKQEEVEDYYEPLDPIDTDNVVIIPVKSIDRPSKINCPLPEIPKEEPKVEEEENRSPEEENIYQCLLEMRSHPEGDESSLHNYELCDNQFEERTRGDGDSDDGYEYCKSPIKPYCHTSSSGIHIAEDYQPHAEDNNKNYTISKSVSGTSTVSYEKIGPERIYEKIPARETKSKDSSPTYSSRHSFVSDYTGYNDNENIYDTIKHGDATSLSHCYESIPNSPSMVKLRDSMKKKMASNVQKRLSFDRVSNISQSTMSSEQKTNSLYGQRSVISYNGQEIAFQVPNSETSVSDRSDRSDDWVDVSDEEKNEQKIIIVRERSRGRKSPISWSQKVRHQWQKSPKQKSDDKVFITSPTKLYLDTSARCPYYSQNDEDASGAPAHREDKVRLIDVLERTCWLNIRTVSRHGEVETQDLVAFLDCDSSDSGHLYESLEPPAPPPPAHPPHPAHPLPLEKDFDSFDSDTDSDEHDKSTYAPAAPALPASRLPTPPTSGQYTLTKIASAAQKKMRQIKRNLTKRYSVAMDGKPFMKSSESSTKIYETKPKKSPIYANVEKQDQVYSNITFNDPVKPSKTETSLTKVYGSLKEELKTVIGDKRASNGDIPPPLPEKPPPEKPETPTSDAKKDSGTLSRKAYFSFKSRFRRASSMVVDMGSDAPVPSALKITNSTFYLTDSMDGDSGFSNCSDNGQPGSTETLSPEAGPRRREGRRRLAESSPCLCPARPALPPPPPPPAPPADAPPPSPAHAHTDFSAVNEELKRLLPTLSRKDKGPRTRTSWYAECGADSSANTSTTSWYAESGLYQPGASNISSSSGASSGSHPASPLPHSLFTHEPLYQFYNAAKVESVCRDTGDSDSDAYEAGSQPRPQGPQGPPGEGAGAGAGAGAQPARPSAMALVAPRGPSRTLWCEVPEVLNSAVLSSLAPAQKRLQEAKFELLTSEASYLNSLNVLESNFIAHPAFREANVLPKEDWETLFATILPVRKCSQLLMNELERCWQENILLQGICGIVRQHAERHFHVYVKYCENQALMVKALQRLHARPPFAAALKKLESHPSCQSLSLHSFLMLPMQRVTRLPLLLDAVLKNLHAEDDEYHACMHALATLNNFVSQCNEGARSTERVEEMYRLARIIEFPPALRHPPDLAPALGRRDRKPVRWLVRSGEMTQLVWKSDELKLTFGKKFHKVALHLFLFNDLLVVTKKKSEECYVAIDHCPRSLLEVCASDAPAAAAKHALLITLLENHEGRTLEMLMSMGSETAWSRWSEALVAPAGGEGAEGEAVYAGWDCPQVAALYAYAPAQPDELPLAEGDVVNVTRKTSEGWYYGERTRDGEAGWFPGAYTAEIASHHVRARNLRQRYRLLALSGTYLGQKKRAI